MNSKSNDHTRRRDILYPCFCTLLCLVCVISICYADFEHSRCCRLESSLSHKAHEQCIKQIDRIEQYLYVARTCYGDKNYNSTIDSLLTECGRISGICSLSRGRLFENLEKYSSTLYEKLSLLPRTLSPKTRALCGELELINAAVSDCIEHSQDFSEHILTLERLSV